MNAPQPSRPIPTASSGKPPLTLPDLIWGPLAVSLLLLVVGLLGLATGQPWLFPSLGPSAFLAAETPGQPASRFYNTVVGHLIGLAAGMAAVWLVGAGSAPAVMATGELVAARVWAAALSAVLAMLGMSLLRASHPPAAATMLIVALGGFKPTWQAAGIVAAGVLILAVLDEGVRHLRLKIVPPPSTSAPDPG